MTETPPSGGRPPFPPGFALALDPATRRIDGGRVLVGGSPLRLLRVTPAGASLLDRFEAGEAVPAGVGAQSLARRLLDAGLAHPRRRDSPFTASDIAVIIPVRDRADELGRTLARAGPAGEVVVVDDGSIDARTVARVATEHGAELVRHERPLGPGAARGTGVATTTRPVLAFVDADVHPDDGWLEPLLAHLADPAVGAVAPRILARPQTAAPAWLVRYEEARSPLDLGPREAVVRPRSPVPYVPSALLLVRRAAFDEVGGFDPALRFGEDVDLVWRLAEAGWTVRYEPAVTVTHPVRPTSRAAVRQRFDYGRSAAPLACRHPGAVAPLTVSGWSAAAWALVAAGAPRSGVGVGLATTAALVPKLRRLEHPVREAVRLGGLGNLYAGRQVAEAVRRAWWPLALTLALHRRSRPALLAAATLPALIEWLAERPPLDPLRWTALRLADDLAYGAGVWTGSLSERSAAALRPAFAGPFPPRTKVLRSIEESR